MEDVLELYQADYDRLRPVVCFDEKGKELLEQITPELAVQPGQVARQDYEYRHNGACNLFIATEPKTGYRHVVVTQQRRAKECAEFLKWLVDEAYPQAQVIRVVCDNLNIHAATSL